MAVESIVYEQENPLAAIPATIGTGPGIPVVIEITTPGTTNFSDYSVPVDSDVTVTLTGGGGGGGSGDGTSTGGGGGGGGGSIQQVVPAVNWVNGGMLTVGAGGAGGLTGVHNGTDGEQSKMTVSDFDETDADGGAGGHATSHAGGVGGLTTRDPGLPTPVRRNGHDGATGLSSGAAVGGKAGFVGSGSGGVGGIGGAGAGGAGANGKITLQFSV